MMRFTRFIGGLMLLAVIILFTFTLATADTQLATSVVASSGGQATSTNFRMKSTLGQSTPIGPSTSTNFEVGAGFWYQDPVAPSAIGDLTATLSVNDIVLEWSHAADNVAIDHYVVFRGTALRVFRPPAEIQSTGPRERRIRIPTPPGRWAPTISTWSRRRTPAGIWPRIPTGRGSSTPG